jgi:hypothetical protein
LQPVHFHRCLDRNILHDEITTTDHALVRRWIVTRNYYREHEPIWYEHICAEENHHVVIGTDSYFLSADDHLMPTRKDQTAPDLKYFNQSRK